MRNRRDKKIEKLNIPKRIKEAIYDESLSFEDYIKYQLEDKVPISCLYRYSGDRPLVEHFGVEKAKRLDWEWIHSGRKFKSDEGSRIGRELGNVVVKDLQEVFLEVDPSIEDPNIYVFELIKKATGKGKEEFYPPVVPLVSGGWEKEEEEAKINSKKKYWRYERISDNFQQRFRRRLNVPKEIREAVYNKELSFENYIKYQLEDKIPASCLARDDRRLLEKFGLERAKLLDWELIHTAYVFSGGFCKKFGVRERTPRDVFLHLDPSIEDPNMYVYGLLEYELPPVRYSSEMKKLYPNRTFEKTADKELTAAMKFFNKGDFSRHKYLKYWELFKDKDCSYAFNHLEFTEEKFREFMSSGTGYFATIWAWSFPDRDTSFIDPHFASLGHRIFDWDSYFQKLDRIFEFPTSNFIFNDLPERIKVIRSIITGYPEGEGYSDPDMVELAKRFRDERPDLFVNDNMPQELKKAYYDMTLDIDYIMSHPALIQMFNGTNIVWGLGEKFLFMACLLSGTNNSESNYLRLQVALEYSKIKHPPFQQLFIGYILQYGSYMGEKAERKISDFLKVVQAYGKFLDISEYDSKGYQLYSIETDFTKDTFQSDAEKFVRSYALTTYGPVHEEDYPEEFKKQNPDLFLGQNVPDDIRQKFYNKKLTIEELILNPELVDLFGETNIILGFDLTYDCSDLFDISSKIKSNHTRLRIALLYLKITSKDLRKLFTNEILQNSNETPEEIEKRISNLFKVISMYEEFVPDLWHQVYGYRNQIGSTKDTFYSVIERCVRKNILEGYKEYSENFPEEFKKKNPDLFLGENVPDDVRQKFCNKELTIEDFVSNPGLIDLFGETNIILGFGWKFRFIVDIINEPDSLKANRKRLQIALIYSKIEDENLRNKFKCFVKENINNVSIEKTQYIAEVFNKLSASNSSEIRRLIDPIVISILVADDPLECLAKIEQIFVKNNIPIVGKAYSCFETLHPNLQEFDFESSNMCPTLQRASTRGRKAIIFSDLIKASFGSNNRSANNYICNIDIASRLFEQLRRGEIKYEELDESDKKELLVFSKHLETLYRKTMRGRMGNEKISLSDDVVGNISEFVRKLSPDGTEEYNLADRIIRMFCGQAGINTLEEAKEYIQGKISRASKRNEEASKHPMTLEEGDLVKGIGGVYYLRTILQNGSVAREYLGASADSDLTPLDTDLSMILDSNGSISEMIFNTMAGSYGPIYFVLKNDGRFTTTRKHSKEPCPKADASKLELFCIGDDGHYGIRTGFASSDINYIVTEEYDPRVGLTIAMNGFYIPVADISGKIVFSIEEYNELRKKMSGLSYYGENSYAFSNNLVTEGINELVSQIDQNNLEVGRKREKINEVMRRAFEKVGLELKTKIDGDLTEGFAELLDTGSTGRGTNKPEDGDFDFIMRLDRSLMINETRLNELREVLKKHFGTDGEVIVTGGGDLRIKGAQLDDETIIDIDITFAIKTDKLEYSTEMCVQDRLSTIKNNDSEKYRYVVANILFAKQFLKTAKAYKSKSSREDPQGGLGGVGIENWVLQNGGSFEDAARSFIRASEGKSFEEFQKSYSIWDFGDNHLAERNGFHPNDNFVYNMSSEGYERMREALIIYIKNIEASRGISTDEMSEEISKQL